MKKFFIFWIERYFYNPNFFQKILSFLLLPFSYFYCFLMYLRFKNMKEEDFGIDIISVGNLSVGGSGKTPLTCALAQNYDDVAIILRGYGRKSRGLQLVKNKGKVLCDVNISGDEAMVYAKKLSNAMVIVSEDRKIAIKRAKILGAKIIFLDDAYSKHSIKKLDLLIDVENKNERCLPSGAFREKKWSEKKAYILKENKDFKREVKIKNKSAKMSLVTAIAKPARLDKYLPSLISRHYFEDHHIFTKDELQNIVDSSDTLLVTLKDFVKIETFGFAVSLLDLDIVPSQKIFDLIDDYRINSAEKN